MQHFGLRRKNKPTKSSEAEVSQSLSKKETVISTADTPKIELSVTEEEATIDKQPVKENQPISQSEIVEEMTKEIPEVSVQKTDITQNKEIEISDQRDPRRKEKIVCPHCKKKFGTPLFTLDFSHGKSEMIRCCPYCFESVDKGHTTKKATHTKKESAETTDEAENKLNFVVKTEELDEVLENYRYLK